MSLSFGLEQSVANDIRSILINTLKLKNSYSVFVFGSRAIGKHKKYSDLDLWIESDPNLSLANITQLREIFEESEIPIKIDIVTPETCLDDYKDKIQNQKVLWFDL